ncbi:MAG: hypothetical protein FWC79_04000 [Oscillospiraceae bacterium]|nr:hypothetical protein [Oscillospiraceae bacterium]
MAIYTHDCFVEISDIDDNLVLSNYGFLRLFQETAGKASASVRVWSS